MHFHSIMAWPPATYDVTKLISKCAQGINEFEQLLKTSGVRQVLMFNCLYREKLLRRGGNRHHCTSEGYCTLCFTLLVALASIQSSLFS